MTGDIPNTNVYGSGPCAVCGLWISYDPYNQHVCQGVPAPNAPLPGLDWSKMQPGPLQWMPFEYKPTQRDYFAARAMQGMTSGDQWPQMTDAAEIAKRAYAIADAMIAAAIVVTSSMTGADTP